MPKEMARRPASANEKSRPLVIPVPILAACAAEWNAGIFAQVARHG